MPRKDPDARREYMREWYARPENRRRTIDKVSRRKRTRYAGVCRNCGGPTVGETLSRIPEWCGKPECKSAQAKERVAAFGPDRPDSAKEKQVGNTN